MRYGVTARLIRDVARPWIMASVYIAKWGHALLVSAN
jgi:hypothetical protein